MTDEQIRIWKEIVITYFKIKSRVSPRESEVTSVSMTSKPSFELGTPEYRFGPLLHLA
jgi:hypothetical protein